MRCHHCNREPQVEAIPWLEYNNSYEAVVTTRQRTEQFYQSSIEGEYVFLCPQCEIGYWRCSDCGNSFRRDTDSWDDYGRCNDCTCEQEEDCGCDDCARERDRLYSRLIHPYSFKPRPVFKGKGPLYLGPEIEVEFKTRDVWGNDRREEAAQLAVDALGTLGYLKEDGSVDGFEVVTHPMSIDYAHEHFPWSMLGELARTGARASAACGMHVHASRAAFSGPAHTFRWMSFFYRNQRAIERMARRAGNGYARFDSFDRKQIKHWAKGSVSDRYVAINTGNRDTYEVRVFASSLNSVQVQANLELVDASIKYAGQIDSNKILTSDAWTWGSFADYVSEKPTYRNLWNKMEEFECVS